MKTTFKRKQLDRKKILKEFPAKQWSRSQTEHLFSQDFKAESFEML